MGETKPKVVIIGGGISGIALGDHLAKNGFKDYVILEASNRTGGRIYTVNLDAEGHKAEMGANWIHGIERNPIFKIADDNNLLELRHGNKGLRNKTSFKMENGDEVTEKIVNQVNLNYGQLIMQAEDFYQSGMPTMEENDSVGAFLEREYEDTLERYTNGDRHVRELLFDQRKRLECCISGCDTLSEVSLSEFGSYEELPGVHYTIPPGFTAVLEILKSSIPKENILLNHPVKCIRWNRQFPEPEKNVYECCVECENGEKFYANHVICTVSLGVLKAACDRMFSPPLPKMKLDAIDAVGFGIVDKVIVQFDEPVTEPELFRVELVWDNDLIEMNDLRHTWYRKIYSFEVVHDNVLVGWLSGKEALYMESLTEEQIGQDIVEALKKFLNKKDIPQPRKVISLRMLLAESLGSRAEVVVIILETDGNDRKDYSPTNLKWIFVRKDKTTFVKGPEDISDAQLKMIDENLSSRISPVAGIHLKVTRWGNNPYTRGSYSFLKVGAQAVDVDALSEPLMGSESDKPQVCFAGEATHPTHYSTTHGALLTGLREGKRLTDLYK